MLNGWAKVAALQRGVEIAVARAMRVGAFILCGSRSGSLEYMMLEEVRLSYFEIRG